jgi:hypothetical protein
VGMSEAKSKPKYKPLLKVEGELKSSTL